jgi:hypothetical protein
MEWSHSRIMSTAKVEPALVVELDPVFLDTELA